MYELNTSSALADLKKRVILIELGFPTKSALRKVLTL
jgi:hypothetical protein